MAIGKSAAKSPTPEPSEPERLARRIATRDSYDIKKLVRVLGDEPEWEVLILGRYKGDDRAGIKGDPWGSELPYRIWVRKDGSGYCTEGW